MQKNLLKSLTLLLSLTALSSCGQEENKFPGFIPVVVDKQEVVYLFDPKSIQDIGAGHSKEFLIIKKQLDGYILQKGKTDCLNSLITQDGTFYPYDEKSSAKTFGGYNLPNIKSDSHISTMVAEVCGNKPLLKVEETKEAMPIGQKPSELADNASLTILQKDKESGFLVMEVNALYSLSDNEKIVVLKKGLEVVVTGISSDKKYYEVKCKSIKDKLYIPADSVALLGQ